MAIRFDGAYFRYVGPSENLTKIDKLSAITAGNDHKLFPYYDVIEVFRKFDSDELMELLDQPVIEIPKPIGFDIGRYSTTNPFEAADRTKNSSGNGGYINVEVRGNTMSFENEYAKWEVKEYANILYAECFAKNGHHGIYTYRFIPWISGREEWHEYLETMDKFYR